MMTKNGTARRARRNPLINHRFVIVAGKGGVGKSTIAASLALASARAGRRTLLFQYGAVDKSATPLGPKLVGEDIEQIEDNLYAVRPSTEAGMREYVLLRLKSKTAYRVVFENDFVRKLLDGIPGVTELIWLGKAYNHERETHDDGRPVWDTIVLDPPATGHSLYLFQVPFVIRDAVPAGPFHNEAAGMVELLQDPSRTALHLITLPEEMPVNEVMQLKGDIDDKMQIPIGSLIANSVFPSRFDERDEAILRRIRDVVPEDGDVIDRLVAAGMFRIDRSRLQRGYLRRLHDELALPTIEIPHYLVPDLDRRIIDDIADRFLAFDGENLAVDGPPDVAAEVS